MSAPTAADWLSFARMIDLTLRCPTCGRRADMCFEHGDDWKKRSAALGPIARLMNGICAKCGSINAHDGKPRCNCVAALVPAEKEE